MLALTSATATDIVQLVDQHAGLIDLAVVDVDIPSNGLMNLTLSSGGVTAKSIPYFTDTVVSGLTLSIQAPPNALTLDYTSGVYQFGGTIYSILLPGTLSIGVGGVSPRLDAVVVDNTSSISIIPGVAAPNPALPVIPAGNFLIGVIFIDVGATSAVVGAYVVQVSPSNYSYLLPNTVNGGTPRWSVNAGRYVAATNLLNDGANVAIGTSPHAIERLRLNGRLIIEDTSAPGIPLNKLYAITGQLYWNGAPIGGGAGVLPFGTSYGNVLIWDNGVNEWVESDVVSLDVFGNLEIKGTGGYGFIKINDTNGTIDIGDLGGGTSLDVQINSFFSKPLHKTNIAFIANFTINNTTNLYPVYNLNSAGGSFIITLNDTNLSSGIELTFRDTTGSCGLFPITINCAPGNILGASSYVLRTPYESITLSKGTTNFNII